LIFPSNILTPIKQINLLKHWTSTLPVVWSGGLLYKERRGKPEIGLELMDY